MKCLRCDEKLLYSKVVNPLYGVDDYLYELKCPKCKNICYLPVTDAYENYLENETVYLDMDSGIIYFET